MHVQAVSDWRDRARVVGFFGRLAVKEHVRPSLHVRPLVAELFLTDNCNLTCVSCACWRTTTRDELSTDEWKAVLDQLKPAGIVKANFTGGEPLLRKDAPELMAYAHARGIRSLHLNTNAVLLNEARRTAVLEAGVRSFNISVDGPTAVTHNLIRGRNAFERTTANLEPLLAQRRRLGLRIRLNFTVMRSTVASLPDMMRFTQSLGLPAVPEPGHRPHVPVPRRPGERRVRRCHRRRRPGIVARSRRSCAPTPPDCPASPSSGTCGGTSREVTQNDLPCAESQLKLMIHSRGEIGGCWGHDGADNIRTTTVAAVIDSSGYRDQHERLFRKDCQGCGSNYSLESGVAAQDPPRQRVVAFRTPDAGDRRPMSRESDILFDGLAAHYDEHFAVPHRQAYDRLAWELTLEQLPAPGARILDVGCGIGRWAGDLIALDYELTGIEPAPAMAARSAQRVPAMRLLTESVETAELEPESFDVALAMGSLQYCEDPTAAFARIHDWLVPGGCVLRARRFPAGAGARAAPGGSGPMRPATGWISRKGAGSSDRPARRCRLFDRSSLQMALHKAGFDVTGDARTARRCDDLGPRGAQPATGFDVDGAAAP